MKKLNVFICLLLLFFSALINWGCYSGARQADAIFDSKDNKIELEATIISSEKQIRIDEGMEKTYWYPVVSYEYNGVSYSSKLSSQRSEPKIGKVVRIEINTENPEEILPDTVEFVLALIFSPIFLSVTSIVLFFIIKFFVELFKKDKSKVSSTSKIIAFLFVLCKLVIESISFYNNYNSFVFGVFSLFAICALIVVLVIFKIPIIDSDTFPDKDLEQGEKL